MYKSKFLGNFSLGLFLGAGSALLLAWVIDLEVSETFEKYAVYLFSALSTLLAAGLALTGTLSVISNQRVLDERTRLGELRAARAALPIVISDINQSSTSIIKYLLRTGGFDGQRTTFSNEEALNIIAIAEHAVATLKECIKYAEKTDADWLVATLRLYQVFRSRLASTNSETWDIERRIIEWTEMSALCDQIFAYARQREDSINPRFDSSRMTKLWDVSTFHTDDLGQEFATAFSNSVARLDGASPDKL